jgi:hypothetical protein
MKKYCISVISLLLAFFNTAISQNYSAEVIKYSTWCEVQENNKISRIDSFSIQINNRSGDDFANISVPYSKSEKISGLEGWIEDKSGIKIRNLKKSEVTDKSAISGISMYEDNFEKCFQLKHNDYPYRIVYTYKTTINEYFTIVWWTPLYINQIPIKKAILQIKIPKGFEYKSYSHNIKPPRVDTLKSTEFLEWNIADLKPIKNEIFSKSEDVVPLVIVSPLNFKYGLEGSLKDWQSYGNWQSRLIKGLDKLPESEQKRVTGLIKNVSDKKEIVKLLYHYLQDQTHYINVTLGIGGMKPYPASYVAQNKYGDCKALSNYMKALLKFAGIESFYANIYSGEQAEYPVKNLVCPQFNHAVLAVPLEKDTIWLENTSNSCPFGYFGISTQNREALIIDEKDSRLVRTPALKREDVHVSRKLDFFLNLNGSANLHLTETFRGWEFERFNHLKENFNDKFKDEYIREYMPFENYEVLDWKLNQLHRDSARIELNANLNLNKYLKSLGSEYYFNLYPIHLPSFTSEKERTLPVILPYPVFISDTLNYHLPQGYELKTKQDPIYIESRYGKYKAEITTQKDVVHVVKSFELIPAEYSLKEYHDFYSFLQSVKQKDDCKIVIKKTNN